MAGVEAARGLTAQCRLRSEGPLVVEWSARRGSVREAAVDTAAAAMGDDGATRIERERVGGACGLGAPPLGFRFASGPHDASRAEGTDEQNGLDVETAHLFASERRQFQFWLITPKAGHYIGRI